MKNIKLLQPFKDLNFTLPNGIMSKNLTIETNENHFLGFDIGLNLGITFFDKDKMELVTQQLEKEHVEELKDWLNNHY